MFGKISTFMVSFVLFAYMILVNGAQTSYNTVKSAIDDIVYDTVESISTTGMMSENLYEGLEDSINRYSLGSTGKKYLIQLKLEKQIKPNVFDVYFESSEDRDSSHSRKGQIVGRPLDVGDKVTIYVEDRTPAILGRLLSFPIMGISTEGKEMFIRTSKTAIVAKRFPDSVKGYDVIADLNTNPFDYINKIVVITKVNEMGREYSTPSNLPSYRTYSISDPSDINYIYPNGEFLRDEDLINGQRVVHYVQKY